MPDKIHIARKTVKIWSRHVLFPGLHDGHKVEFVIPDYIWDVSIFSQVWKTSAIPVESFHGETLLFSFWVFFRALAFLADDLDLRPVALRSQILVPRSGSSKSTSVKSLIKWERNLLSYADMNSNYISDEGKCRQMKEKQSYYAVWC